MKSGKKTTVIENGLKSLLKATLLQLKKSALLPVLASLFIAANLNAAELYVGAASANITPKLPVSLAGQFYTRIAHTIGTPLTSNVVVLESREGNQSLDMAVMVSCDIVAIPENFLKAVREKVHEQTSEIDVNKIFLNAIHTHTAPVFKDDYKELFAQRTSEAIIKAWKNRKPGTVSWGLGHAAVAQNRRAVYSKKLPTPGNFANGTAQMYGNTNQPEFINLEGMEDHDVNALFFWDKGSKLIATTINVPCPAQEVEGDTVVNADYWHPVREKLKSRFGPDLVVVGWIGAAGDQSPHLMYRKAAEERMMKLRNLNRLEEIGRRIVLAVEEAYETVKNDKYSDVQLIHKVETLSLPMRIITDEEYAYAKSEYDKAAAELAADSTKAKDVASRMGWNKRILERYEKQKTDPNPKKETEVHVIRLGDVAICSNQFELFTDFGIRMQARSKALQTFVIQLAGQGSYLPTEKAVKGGGYSAIPQSNQVGPEGGQVLVDLTVELINGMWPDTK